MGEKMSLQQVRDAMLEEKAWARSTGWPMAAGTLQRWADAIDAHRAQPAQEVDVEAIREVIAFIRSRRHGAIWEGGAADKLEAALPNANGKEDTDAAR